MTTLTAQANPAGVWPGYLHCLEEADEYAAIEVATGLLEAGVPAERVLLDLIAPAQAEVGERWVRNEWSVAQEHAATHVSERVVAAVAGFANPRPTRGRIILTSRGVPAPALGSALENYGRVLHDFPRAARFLEAARSSVAARGGAGSR
ncbi:B12-binding domain-containing protein [Micromonospora sp. NPDC047620]|uniref:cobalamin B12-binding domain-containing protein n=1 Tax=Micromonospora sp. NPDC047620 TaxID=3364251 RepID=UPI00371F5898